MLGLGLAPRSELAMASGLALAPKSGLALVLLGGIRAGLGVSAGVGPGVGSGVNPEVGAGVGPSDGVGARLELVPEPGLALASVLDPVWGLESRSWRRCERGACAVPCFWRSGARLEDVDQPQEQLGRAC